MVELSIKIHKSKAIIILIIIIIVILIIIIIIRRRRRRKVFCPRVDPSVQAQEPRLQFCPRQVFHRKLRNQGCSFTRDWIGAVLSASHSLFSI